MIPSTHAGILNRAPRFCAPRFLLVWTQGILIVSPPVALQKLSFNVHRITLSTGWVFERIGAGFVCLLSRGKEAEPVSKERHDDSKNRLQVTSKTRSSWRRGKGKGMRNKHMVSSCSELYYIHNHARRQHYLTHTHHIRLSSPVLSWSTSSRHHHLRA